MRKPPAPPQPINTKPLTEIEWASGLTHEIALIDSGSGKRGKPEDAVGAMMFMTIGNTPPVNAGDMPLAGITLKTRFERTFEGGDVGKNAYYSFCWFDSQGRKGPFGPITAATIAA